MKVWVTRDGLTTDKRCGIFEGSKKPCVKFGCYPVSDMDISDRRFVKKFGFLPEVGSCKQYELSLKEIE